MITLQFREKLKRNYSLGRYFLNIEFDDLKTFDEEAANKIKRYPATFIPAVLVIYLSYSNKFEFIKKPKI